MNKLSYNDIMSCKTLTDKERTALLKYYGYTYPKYEVYKVTVKPVVLIEIEKLF